MSDTESYARGLARLQRLDGIDHRKRDRLLAENMLASMGRSTDLLRMQRMRSRQYHDANGWVPHCAIEVSREIKLVRLSDGAVLFPTTHR
jgi:hypothetical protein